MKLTKSQFEILLVFWSEDVPLSVEEIAARSSFRFFKGIRTKLIVEQLIEMGIISQAGLYQDFSQAKGTVFPSYMTTICFTEFFCKNFNGISPYNLYLLAQSIICSEKLNAEMLYALGKNLSEKTGLTLTIIESSQ